MLKKKNNNILRSFITILLYLYKISFKLIIPFLSFSYFYPVAMFHLNNITSFA